MQVLAELEIQTNEILDTQRHLVANFCIKLTYFLLYSTAVIFWFCLAVMLNGASNSGFQVNHVELSSNYSGTLMGVTNTAANMAGFMAPYVTGLVIDGNVSTFLIYFIIFVSTFNTPGASEGGHYSRLGYFLSQNLTWTYHIFQYFFGPIHKIYSGAS